MKVYTEKYGLVELGSRSKKKDKISVIVGGNYEILDLKDVFPSIELYNKYQSDSKLAWNEWDKQFNLDKFIKEIGYIRERLSIFNSYACSYLNSSGWLYESGSYGQQICRLYDWTLKDFYRRLDNSIRNIKSDQIELIRNRYFKELFSIVREIMSLYPSCNYDDLLVYINKRLK